MSADQDTRAAELLGWHKGVGGAISGIAGQESPSYWYDADGKRCAPCITDAFANMYPFSPSTNHAHARVLEDAIERLDIAHNGTKPFITTYMEAIFNAVDASEEMDSHGFLVIDPADVWMMLRATPAQRTAAFIAAMEQAS